MNKLFTILISSLFILNISSQISQGGIPYSFKHPLITQVSESKITPPSVRFFQSLSNNDKSSYCVGTTLPTSLNPLNSGTWINHENGSRSWLIKISSSEAIGLSLNYSSFTIPEGAEVFLYNEKRNHVIGKYTSARNYKNPITHTQIVEGQTTILEYYEPANCTQNFKLEIESVVYYFRGFEDYFNSYKANNKNNRAEYCQVDVACSPESDGWDKQIDAVVHFVFPDGGSYYVCSGAVINNTNHDCTPYILTAWHCGEHTANQNLSGYTWYWNYQKSNCQPNNNGSDPSKGNKTMINGAVRSSSGSGTLNNPPGDNQMKGSDFSLIELNSNIPQSYNAFYAGWDRGSSLKSSGVSIHHPNGSAKKISTFDSNLQSQSYNGGAFNAHWMVFWSETVNGHGVTEGGSSGSPIFDQNKKIVGQLSGGSSECDYPDDPDLYGKFSKNWVDNGSSEGAQLAPWLDPNGTNLTDIEGIYFSCQASSSTSSTGIGGSVNFNSTSNSNITNWSWDFDVNNIGGVNPSTSSLQNPTAIEFNNIGNYEVSLTTTNSSGNTCNSTLNINITNTTSIISENEKELKIYPNPNKGSFIIDFNKFKLKNEQIFIYDQSGRLIKTINLYGKDEILIEGLNPGVYYVKTKFNSLINNKIIVLN